MQCRKFFFSPSPSKKILFSDSKADWRKDITKGFKNSRHTIAFNAITSENIKPYDLLVPLTVQDLEN